MDRDAGPRAHDDGPQARLSHQRIVRAAAGASVRGGFADVNQRGLTVLAERALPEEEITQEILDREILQAEMAYDSTNDPAAKHAAESAVAQLREAKAALNF
jgi:F0F1-type ATP synthase epsilon subunit